MDRKPLKYEQEHRLLTSHTHSLQKPPSHYLDPPKLPAEELEPANDAEARERRRRLKSLMKKQAEARAPVAPALNQINQPGAFPQNTGWPAGHMPVQNTPGQMPQQGYSQTTPRMGASLAKLFHFHVMQYF